MAAGLLTLFLLPAADAAALPANSAVTVSALGSEPESVPVQRRRRRSRRRGQSAPSSDRIKEIQAALIREGFLEGKPTGEWDKATIAAVRKFQEEHEFPVTGKPEALTLIALGLGPDTAGRGAPRSGAKPESSEETEDNKSGSPPPNDPGSGSL